MLTNTNSVGIKIDLLRTKNCFEKIDSKALQVSNSSSKGDIK